MANPASDTSVGTLVVVSALIEMLVSKGTLTQEEANVIVEGALSTKVGPNSKAGAIAAYKSVAPHRFK